MKGIIRKIGDNLVVEYSEIYLPEKSYQLNSKIKQLPILTSQWEECLKLVDSEVEWDIDLVCTAEIYQSPTCTCPKSAKVILPVKEESWDTIYKEFMKVYKNYHGMVPIMEFLSKNYKPPQKK